MEQNLNAEPEITATTQPEETRSALQTFTLLSSLTGNGSSCR